MSFGRSAGVIVAPVALGACFAVAAPPTKSAPEPATPRVEPAVVPVEVGVDQPGEPEPELKEALPPKVEAGGFTRKLDRARIAARGAPRAKGLDSAALREAALFDNEAWTGAARRELLAYLRGGDVETGAAFTEADARIVAQLQSGSSAEADGKLRDETMAVLFAMGLRLSLRKPMAREVRLEFYPGELEDLDGWNREIEENVTKKGGGYRDVSPPVGEGSIYVRVGRSIVACYRGRGGPPAALRDDAEHVAVPTKPGIYELGPAQAHVTRSWYFSQIPWGAEIRKSGDGYEYRSPGRSTWAWATRNPKNTLKMPLDGTDFEGLPETTHDGVTYAIWNKNDFGPIAWNLVPSDLYLHTTPDTETGTRPPGLDRSLSCSHGCVHIDPRERDEMMTRGYLGAGVRFIVHRWDEHLLPDPVRHDMVLGTGVASKS